MDLETLLLQQFLSYTLLAEKMALYQNRPAIFMESAPDDSQKGWGGHCQYPRIVFTMYMQANQERKSSGVLQVDLYCATNGLSPEDIEPIIKCCLKDLFLNPGVTPYCFAWSRTDGYDLPTRENITNTKVVGSEIRFDVLEYPSQETSDPDPIVAMNRYIKRKIPEVIVIGIDQIPEIMETNTRMPVFYCRLDRVSKAEETNMVAWMKGQVAVHIICPAQSDRNKYVMSLVNSLSLDGEVIMLDHSPMTVTDVTMNSRADYLKDGQLMVSVKYGLLRYRAQPHKIREINFSI